MGRAEPADRFQAAETSVRVALRIRPMLGREKVERCRSCLATSPDSSNPQIIIGKDRAFTFDYVFDSSPSSGSQEQVYATTVRPLIDACIQGYNATVLAYGQTGSGKTYTMGSECKSLYMHEEVGIIPRAIGDLFSLINSAKQQNPAAHFLVRVSFMELYGEELPEAWRPEDWRRQYDFQRAATTRAIEVLRSAATELDPSIMTCECAAGTLCIAVVPRTERLVPSCAEIGVAMHRRGQRDHR